MPTAVTHGDHASKAPIFMLFPSNLGTMIASKALRDAGVRAMMIPTPPTVTSTSNLCLSLEPAAERDAVATLAAANVSLSSIVR